MAQSSTKQSDRMRPLTLLFLAAAVLGWIIVIALLVSRSDLRSDMETRLEEVDSERVVLVDRLEQQETASGTLQEVQATLEQTRGELAQAEEQRDEIRAELKTAQQELASVKQQEKESVAHLEEVTKKVAPIDKRLANQKKLVDDAEKKTIARTDELAVVGERLKQARSQEAELRASVSQLSSEASDLAEQAKKSETRVQNVRDAEVSLRQKLDQAREELATVKKQHAGLKESLAQLSSRRQQLAADTSAAEAQRDALQQEVSDLSQTMSARADELAQIETRIEGLQEQGAQTAAARIVGLRVGPYQSEGIEAAFEADGTFTMTPQGGEQMKGRYAVSGSDLTLEGVEKAAEGYSFPIKCEISFEPTGFSLAAPEGAEDGCASLAGKTFAQQ